MIDRDRRMGEIFKRPPMAVFKRGKNLKELLTRARIPRGGRNVPRMRMREAESRVGFVRCSKAGSGSQCRMCPFSWDGVGGGGAMRRGNEVVREIDMGELGPKIKIEQRLSCRSKNVVYLAKDLRDGKLYFGESKREVRFRFTEHLRAIEDCSDRTAVGEHFTRQGHGPEDLVMIPIIQVRGGAFERKSIERRMINRYNLVERGMNRNL